MLFSPYKTLTPRAAGSWHSGHVLWPAVSSVEQPSIPYTRLHSSAVGASWRKKVDVHVCWYTIKPRVARRGRAHAHYGRSQNSCCCQIWRVYVLLQGRIHAGVDSGRVRDSAAAAAAGRSTRVAVYLPSLAVWACRLGAMVLCKSIRACPPSALWLSGSSARWNSPIAFSRGEPSGDVDGETL